MKLAKTQTISLNKFLARLGQISKEERGGVKNLEKIRYVIHGCPYHKLAIKRRLNKNIFKKSRKNQFSLQLPLPVEQK